MTEPQDMTPATKPTPTFLTDDDGTPSTMRIMSLISLGASIAFGVMTLTLESAETSTGLYLVFFFLLGAFAPKSLQKHIEKMAPKK